MRKAPMLPSFSSGAKVQVEYTSVPPSHSIQAAASRIAACRSAQSRMFSILQPVSAASSFRNIPSPEHGASTRTLSKNAGKCSASAAGSMFVTTACRIPIRSTFWERILARCG